MNRLILAASTTIVALGSAMSYGQVSSAAMADKYKAAVVYLTVTFTSDVPGAMPSVRHGTGFIIDPTGVIMTASHVIIPGPDERLDRISGRIRSADGDEYRLQTFVPGFDSNRRAVEPRSHAAFLLLPDIRNDWPIIDVASSPLPRVKPDFQLVALTIGPPLNDVLGVPGQLLKNRPAENGFYPTNVQFVAGASGCPILNSEGQLVGLCEAGDPSNAALTLMNPIGAAKEDIDFIKGIMQAAQVAASRGSTRPVSMVAVVPPGTVKAVTQRFCADESAGSVLIAGVSAVGGTPGAEIKSVEVDANKTNCVNVSASLANSASKGRPIKPAWISVDIKAKASQPLAPSLVKPGTIPDMATLSRDTNIGL